MQFRARATLIAAATLAAACASQPSAPVGGSAAAPSTARAAAPAPSNAIAATAATAPTAPKSPTAETRGAELARAASGYRVVTRDGVSKYCKRESTLGTRLSKEYCLSEDELLERARRGEAIRQDMMRSSGVCGSSTCTPGGG